MKKGNQKLQNNYEKAKKKAKKAKAMRRRLQRSPE